MFYKHLLLADLSFQPDCKKTERADIIFLVDGSTSIDRIPGAWDSMMKFMDSIVNETTVGPNLTRFGLILFSTDAKNSFTLDQHTSKIAVREAIKAQKLKFGNTGTPKALNFSLPFFSEKHGGRAALGVPQILMLITDGEAQKPSELPAASAALRDSGISTFAIGIKDARVDQLMIVAGNDASKVFYVDNFSALEGLHRNISEVLCKTTKPGMLLGPALSLVHFPNDGGTNAHQWLARKKCFMLADVRCTGAESFKLYLSRAEKWIVVSGAWSGPF